MSVLDLTTSRLDSRLKLIDFRQATPETLQQLTEQALLDAENFLDNLGDTSLLSPDQAIDIIEQFNTLTAKIERPAGILMHLNYVVSNDKIRHAHHEVLPKLSSFSTKVGQSVALYQIYKTLQDNFEQLDGAYQTDAHAQAINKALQNFVLSGVALDDDKKAQFAQIQSELSLLSAKFADNTMDASNHYARPLHAHELSGISENGLALLKTAGDNYKQKNPDAKLPTDYVATLDIPMYFAIMQFADDRVLREEVYHAYTTRASDQSPDTTAFDNAPLMTKIINLRTQAAALLGMSDYAEYSLATKMADSSEQIEQFLLQLSAAARPKAESEYAEVQAFGKTLGIDEVMPWDIPYIEEKLQLAKFNLTSDELRPYFPLPVVLDGLFEICRKLFGITLSIADKADYTAWHDDVLFCQIHDEISQELLGGLYLDLFARHGKQGGAWLDDYQKRNLTANDSTLPVGFIVGNFAPPIDDKPSLLNFDEVNTLFHEFGHALHHITTQVNVAAVAGINGVEWDAVELPSQFMENFAINAEGIRAISRHIQTGEPLPEDKLNALIDTKNFQKGLQTLRQMELGLFDLRLHTKTINHFGNIEFDDILAVMDKVREEVAVIIPPSYNRFGNGFTHIFAGGYACGYYSYIWAEVLSSDAFGKFEEEGIYNPQTGRAFRQEILARGSSRSAKENYMAFRGREANAEALLRHRGLK
ncbi:M3 family metallopeptidase [Moraxella nasicaprae]